MSAMKAFYHSQMYFSDSLTPQLNVETLSCFMAQISKVLRTDGRSSPMLTGTLNKVLCTAQGFTDVSIFNQS